MKRKRDKNYNYLARSLGDRGRKRQKKGKKKKGRLGWRTTQQILAKKGGENKKDP